MGWHQRNANWPNGFDKGALEGGEEVLQEINKLKKRKI